MAKNEEEIHRLKNQLQWEGAGPITDFSNQAITLLLGRSKVFVQWLREFTEQHPFISLLLALQVGVAVARWGTRHAKR